MSRQVQKKLCPSPLRAPAMRSRCAVLLQIQSLLIVLRCSHQFDILRLSDGKTIIYMLPTHSHIGYSDTGHAWLASVLTRLSFLLPNASSHSNFYH